MVDGGLPTIKTGACRKWRLQARLPLLPLKAFDHRGLFAADISACATMNEYIEVIARARRVLADQLGFVSLPDCGFQNLRFINILTANIDISGARTHCETCEQGAFHELVRILPAYRKDVVEGRRVSE